MNIRFVSSLTPDDENRLAPALLAAVGGILDQLPFAYTIRIETAAGRNFSHDHVPHDDGHPEPLVGPSQSGAVALER